MNSDDVVNVLAGLFVFLSVSLGMFYDLRFLYFTMFVGLNLFQYGFSGFCPLKVGIEKVFF